MGVKRKIVKKQKNEIPVWDVFEMFRAEKKIMGIGEKTLTNYAESLKRFLQILQYDDIKICELDKDDLQCFHITGFYGKCIKR